MIQNLEQAEKYTGILKEKKETYKKFLSRLTEFEDNPSPTPTEAKRLADLYSIQDSLLRYINGEVDIETRIKILLVFIDYRYELKSFNVIGDYTDVLIHYHKKPTDDLRAEW